MAKMKKYQGGGTMDPRVAEFLKKRQAADTSKPYNREDMIANMNKQIMAEIKNPKLADERRRKTDSAMYADWQKDSAAVRKFHEKEGDLVERRKDGSMKYTVMPKKNKDGGKVVKKAKSGGAFGMLSVKAGIDKNPNPTQADRIAGAKKLAKSGKKVVKKVAKKLKSGGTVSSQLGSYKGVIGKNTKGKATKAVGLVKAKYGKSMGKCKNGC